MPLWNISRNKKTAPDALGDDLPAERSILDYAADQTKSFAEVAFCDVDALVLTMLSYITYDGLVQKPSLFSRSVRLHDIAAKAAGITVVDSPSDEQRIHLLTIAAENPRFAGIKLNHYVNELDHEQEKQFSAVTFFLPDRTAFVAYRGTDNTIVGWRENFNMAFECPVPAQAAAVSYLNTVAGLTIRKLRISGHSKGGNLAVYASLFCTASIRDRLIEVFSFDGPGFRDMLFESSQFRRLQALTHCIVPQGSMIGTLLYQNNDYRVVTSTGSGFGQHNPFTWQLDGANMLDAPQGLTPEAKRFDETINNWMATMSDSQRKLIVNTLFDLIEQSRASSFTEVTNKLQSGEWNLRKSVMDLAPPLRKEIIDILISLASAYRKAGKASSGVQQS